MSHQSTDPTETYTVPQFCAAHNISRSHFYVLQKRGQGPRIKKAGGRTLITKKDAKEWLET